MKFLRLDEASPGTGDRVFRQSARTAGVATAAFGAAAAVVVAAGWRGLVPMFVAAVSAAVLLVFMLIAGLTWRRSLAPSNWLMFTDGQRLLVKLRSYLNTDLPADRPCIVELRAADVAAFRVTTSRQTGHDAAGSAAHDTSVYLDVVLSEGADVDALRALLAGERELRSRGGVWRHHPVTLADDRTMRIEWRGRHARVAPDIDEAIRALSWCAGELPAGRERVDLGSSGQRPANADAARQVRALAEQGRVMEATVLASRSFGMGTAEARQYVERVALDRGALPPRQRQDLREGPAEGESS
jgi:hypothetical protein